MSKDYYFHDTGEVRIPKAGEYFMCKDGSMILRVDLGPNTCSYPIYTRHEVEVPKGVPAIYITDIPYHCNLCAIPFDRSKSKVKKWKWACGGTARRLVTVTDYLSEQEMREYQKEFPGFWYHKINETEIEVDE